ncbi:MAG: dihydrofolate reductase [Acidiferrobacterales bacterium]|nr:dihydrofolate reductase [Acidiferrobacterales bacterium]
MSLPSPLRGAIVAMNADRVIGIDGDLPWHYSADLKRFKQRTLDTAIIMGRLTWNSIGGKPLPRRRNMVVSRTMGDQVDSGAEWFTSLESALESVAEDDAWVIGGGQLYAAAMDWLNLIDLTLVPDQIERQDVVRFPEMKQDEWTLIEESPLEGAPDLINQIYQRTL